MIYQRDLFDSQMDLMDQLHEQRSALWAGQEQHEGQPSTAARWILVDADISGGPIVYRDGEGRPTTYATREEAQRELDEDQQEFARQVAEGERDEDEMPEPDEIHACTVMDDGSVVLEDGTMIPVEK